MPSLPLILTLPNLLTCFRFAAAPFLLWLAWNARPWLFLALLALVFLSDLLDGLAARLTGQVSEFGAALDSMADAVTYLTIALGCWWLWPDIISTERLSASLLIASALTPSLIGFIKFHCLTSYHTWLVKIAAAVTGTSLYLLFLGGFVLPFRFAAIVSLVAAAEEIVITMWLSRPESNIKSLWLLIRRENT